MVAARDHAIVEELAFMIFIGRNWQERMIVRLLLPLSGKINVHANSGVILETVPRRVSLTH
jgi:hypothetical protein